MAIPEDAKSGSNSNVNYKQMYRNLKRKLKILIQENECFKSELRRIQGQYLQVDRDNNFLLERLMPYENFESSSSDSGATDSSDNDMDPSAPVKTEPPPSKRKRASESAAVVDSGEKPAPTSKKKRSASASAATSSRTPATSGRNSSKTMKVSIAGNAVTKNATAVVASPFPATTSVNDLVAGPAAAAGTSSAPITVMSRDSPSSSTSSYFTITNVTTAASTSAPIISSISRGSSNLNNENKRTGMLCQTFPESSSSSQENNHSSPFSAQK